LISLRDFDWDDNLIDATKRDGRARVRVYRSPHVVVVLGRGSQPDVEVNVEAAQRDGVPLLRRRGGGCSVVLDTGNVIVSCTLPLPGLGGTTRAFRTISNWLINALNEAGVPNVRQEGTSDLAVGDRKIGGACIYRTKGLLYYTTTLLLQPDVELIERYLLHPPREPDYRAGRTHRAFLGPLADSLPLHDIDSFALQIDQLLVETVDILLDGNSPLNGQNVPQPTRQEALA
jgi:lipoate-protein ligase A